MLLAFALALGAACRGADQVAQEGWAIDVAANPTTIPLINGSGTSEVVATVSSAAGVPQKDMDVRFTTSSGSLFTQDGGPGANIPIRTDDLGNAYVTLLTGRTTTVTARSGLATGSLTLDTVIGNLNAIILNQDTTAVNCLQDLTFLGCSDILCLEAQAVDTDGVGIAGVGITFELQNATNEAGDEIGGDFSPTQATTDGGGFVRTIFRLRSTCPDDCGGGETCSGDVVAMTLGGSFPSTPITFDTSIP
jgi:hypothetical protein